MSYVIAIDGGGTKTMGIIAKTDGEILETSTFGPSNISTLGVNRARLVIERVYYDLLRKTKLRRSDIIAVCMGLAGLDSPRILREVRIRAWGWGLAKYIRVEQDSTIALAAATKMQEPGAIVIAGTGSVVMATNGRGRIVKIGGWGYILNDEGSAFYIGYEALKAISKSFDGRLPRTRLLDYILNEYKVRTFFELLEKIYREGFTPTKIAQLAPLVTKAAEEGDRIAISILQKAGEELALMVITALRRLGLRAAKICYTGGVFNAGKLVIDPFTNSIRRVFPNVTIERLKYPPVIGALYLALQTARVQLTEEVLNKIHESAEKIGLKVS